jgi:tRNA pseudouridine32 synthase / 23S rRNA pseudouridine746 synthase
VHMYHSGHPVAGDMLYGDKNIQKNFPRLMLHAERVEFKARSGREIAVESIASHQLFVVHLL